MAEKKPDAVLIQPSNDPTATAICVAASLTVHLPPPKTDAEVEARARQIHRLSKMLTAI
jgi:hypothetical protein